MALNGQTPTISDEILTRLAPLQSGVITDAMGRLGLSGWMDGVLPVRRDARLIGRARTVTYGPTSGEKHSAATLYTIIRDCGPGDVLVLSAEGTQSWIFGENVANLARLQGLAGMVTDGRIRDTAEIHDMDFTVFAAGSATRPHAPGLEIVAVDAPVHCGGASVRTGDLVFGDADGIVVAPQSRIDAVAAEAEDLNALELEQEKAIAAQASLDEIGAILSRKKKRVTAA